MNELNMTREIMFKNIIIDLENPLTNLDVIIDACDFIEKIIFPDIEETNESEAAEKIINQSQHWINLLSCLKNIQNKDNDDITMELVNICEDNFVVEKEEHVLSEIAIVNALFEALYSQIKAMLFKVMKGKELETEDDLIVAQDLYDDIIKDSIIRTAFIKK